MLNEWACQSCGFLAVREVQSRQLVEAEEKFRAAGEPVFFHGVAADEAMPLCLKRIADFEARDEQ